MTAGHPVHEPSVGLFSSGNCHEHPSRTTADGQESKSWVNPNRRRNGRFGRFQADEFQRALYESITDDGNIALISIDLKNVYE
jgi:hypothetical protein